MPVSGSTQTGAALEYLLREELSESKGQRSSVRSVIVTITDGASQDDVGAPAAAARARGAELFAVAVTGDVNEAQLLQLAGGQPDRLFKVPNFQDLALVRNRPSPMMFVLLRCLGNGQLRTSTRELSGQ